MQRSNAVQEVGLEVAAVGEQKLVGNILLVDMLVHYS